MNDFQKQLNARQWEAVSYCSGPSLVIAGAGSGKTRVLTYKIAYLLEMGVSPFQILALTFTNKAAREMRDRIAAIVGPEKSRHLAAGTFHSIFARILRREAAALGYDRDYTIYDETDTRSILKNIVRELGLNDKDYKSSKIAHRISMAKNSLILPDAYSADRELIQRDQRAQVGETHRIYALYQRRLQQANAMDFDDLLLNTYLLFYRFPEVLEHYRKRFAYILVDEYQDTNTAQFRIIRQLAPPEANLCVVGDDSQSIYGFRGAEIGNILNFQQVYPTARLIKLEQNYRSTRNIVGAANSIISHNQGRIPKEVYVAEEKEDGAPLQIIEAYSDKDEALRVARQIIGMRGRQANYDEIAVLYRTNAQSRSFEEAFQNANIPYRMYGGLSFYQRKEVKDVIAYLRCIVNPNDEEALVRIFNYPARGIGETTVRKLRAAAAEHDVPLWDVVQAPLDFGADINRGTQTKVAAFAALLQSFQKVVEATGAYEMAVRVVEETGIKRDLLSDDSPEAQARRENVDELLNSIRTFEADQLEEQGRELALLSDYLPQVALLTDQDRRDDGSPKVSLMTMHAAKGLEFGVVFVVGLEEELFPAASARYNPREMEEERRLFYVAVTRAERLCFLTYAKARWMYGQMQYGAPSPFLAEIDSRFVRKASDFARPERAASPKPAAQPTPVRLRRLSPLEQSRPATIEQPRQRDAIAIGSGTLRVGTRVEHERFGRGTVVSLEGSGISAKARIAFEGSGEKNLLLKFAKLKVLDV